MPKQKKRKQSLQTSLKKDALELKSPVILISVQITTEDAKLLSISQQQKLAEVLLASLRNQLGRRKLDLHFTLSLSMGDWLKTYEECSYPIKELSSLVQTLRKLKQGSWQY